MSFILRLITDPLVFCDLNGNVLASADDSYHLISQDSHTIKINNEVSFEMAGKIKFLGEAYDIYDTSGNKIAYAEFDFLNLSGKVVNNDGDTISIYRANPILKDFTIYIDPDALLMTNH